MDDGPTTPTTPMDPSALRTAIFLSHRLNILSWFFFSTWTHLYHHRHAHSTIHALFTAFPYSPSSLIFCNPVFFTSSHSFIRSCTNIVINIGPSTRSFSSPVDPRSLRPPGLSFRISLHYIINRITLPCNFHVETNRAACIIAFLTPLPSLRILYHWTSCRCSLLSSSFLWSTRTETSRYPYAFPKRILYLTPPTPKRHVSSASLSTVVCLVFPVSILILVSVIPVILLVPYAPIFPLILHFADRKSVV